MDHGLTAASAYRESQLDHLDTHALCTAAGISYEPLVFTVQGGIERHAESILTQIAVAIASEEETTAAEIKSDMLQTISVSLARSAAKTVMRRKPRICSGSQTSRRRTIAEVQLLEDPNDLDT